MAVERDHAEGKGKRGAQILQHEASASRIGQRKHRIAEFALHQRKPRTRQDADRQRRADEITAGSEPTRPARKAGHDQHERERCQDEDRVRILQRRGRAEQYPRQRGAARAAFREQHEHAGED
jgi:hypothetical protein